MTVEQGTETRTYRELPFSEVNPDLIREFLPGWNGSASKELSTRFFHNTDGHLDLSVALLTGQGDIWIKDETARGRWGKPRQVLDEDYCHLGNVENVVIYQDEGRITFFTNDKKGRVEIFNKGKTIVVANRTNRTSKVVTIDVP